MIKRKECFMKGNDENKSILQCELIYLYIARREYYWNVPRRRNLLFFSLPFPPAFANFYFHPDFFQMHLHLTGTRVIPLVEMRTLARGDN